MNRTCAAVVLVLAVSHVPEAFAAPGDSFSFAVIADPHIHSTSPSSTYSLQLQQAVDWINNHRLQEGIELTFVVGDIGWGDGLAPSKEMLDALSMPYVPLIGDNEIHAGSEEAYHTTFAPVYDALADLSGDPNSGLSNWVKAPAQVWNPQWERYSYFQNFRFEYRGVQFVSLDWCSRNRGTGKGEDGDVHDFPGGTLGWFSDAMASISSAKQENTVLLAHNPMFTLDGQYGQVLAALGAFSRGEFQKIEDVLLDPNHAYADQVALALTGHYHNRGFLPEDINLEEIILPLPGDFVFDPNDYDPNNGIELVPLPGYDLYVIDDTHEDPPWIEIVTVTEGAESFSYASRPILIPEPSMASLLLLGEMVRRGARRRRRLRSRAPSDRAVGSA